MTRYTFLKEDSLLIYYFFYIYKQHEKQDRILFLNKFRYRGAHYFFMYHFSDMEMAVMTQLQATVLQRSSCLYKIVALYAELDCLMSLAQASQDYGYCAPTYTERSRLNLQHARYTATPQR